jgi:hypothetical protein
MIRGKEMKVHTVYSFLSVLSPEEERSTQLLRNQNREPSNVSKTKGNGLFSLPRKTKKRRGEKK